MIDVLRQIPKTTKAELQALKSVEIAQFVRRSTLANVGSNMATRAKAAATAARKAKAATTAAAEATTKRCIRLCPKMQDDSKDIRMSNNDERQPAWAQGIANDEQIFVLGAPKDHKIARSATF